MASGNVKVMSGTRPPWVGLVAAVWVQMAAGNAYMFPLYSPELKSVLGYDQRQLAMLGVANDVGENLGVIAGVLCNSLPPWLMLLVGAALCFLGFGTLWLAVSGTVRGMPYWLLWTALAIGTNSNAWFVTAVLLLLAPLAIPVKMTLLRKRRRPTEAAAAAACVEETPPASAEEEPLLIPSDVPPADACGGRRAAGGSGRRGGEEEEAAEERRGLRARRALVKADFWLLWFGYFIGVGMGVTVLNNLAQIGAAASIADTTVLLSLFGLGNFLGRLGGGAVSETFVRSALLLPRPVWMALAQTVLAVAYLCVAYALSPGVVYACAAAIGVCYGAQFAVMIPTTSELFGLRNFGLFYNLMAVANPLGAVLFSEELVGRLYDAEAARQRRRQHACLGPDCFRVAFVVLAGCCALGTAVSLVLAARIRPVYRSLYGGGSFRLPNSSQQH